jgi:hypothetical protein
MFLKRYSSFSTSLDLGLDNGAYYHELFLRGRPMLAMRMRRHKVKGTGVKLGSNPEMEPNFYTLDLPRLPELWELDASGAVPVDESNVSFDNGNNKEEVVNTQEDESHDSDESSVVVEPRSVNSNEHFGRRVQSDNWQEPQDRASQSSPAGASQKPRAQDIQSGPFPSPSLLSESELERRSFLNASQPMLQDAYASLRPQLAVAELARHLQQGRLLNEEARGLARPLSTDRERARISSRGSRESETKRELAHNELLLEKQRQELSLLTAMTNLKRQEYELMTKMCQLGENAISRGLVYRAAMHEAGDQDQSSTIEAAILHDQLASVRALQRSEVGRVPPEMLQRSSKEVDRASALAGYESLLQSAGHFSAASSLLQPSEAVQRAVLNSRQETLRATEVPGSPSMVHAARRLSVLRRGGDDEPYDAGRLAFPYK